MRDLNHDFKNLCQRNRDGSFATQHDRESILTLIANQLDEDGFRHLRATGVRSKHVEHLVERWHAEEISAGTFKNRMSALRWLAEKIDKQNIVARDNAAYGIADRHHVTNVSKAHELDADKLAAVSDPYTALSLRLQEAFGLRREESIKLRPSWADRGDVLHLKASWTKGGKERDIPIRTEAQTRAVARRQGACRCRQLDPGRDVVQGPAQSLQGANGEGRHRPRSWVAAPLRADAPRGADGLEGAGCGRGDFEATECGSEGDRPTSAPGDLARTRARARANNSGLPGAVRCPQATQAAAAGSCRRKTWVYAGVTLSRSPTA